jgi:hypothetical protein
LLRVQDNSAIEIEVFFLFWFFPLYSHPKRLQLKMSDISQQVKIKHAVFIYFFHHKIYFLTVYNLRNDTVDNIGDFLDKSSRDTLKYISRRFYVTAHTSRTTVDYSSGYAIIRTSQVSYFKVG